MPKDGIARRKRAESLVFAALILLSLFWLIDTVYDTIIVGMNCACDMGISHVLEAGTHFVLLVVQVLLIVYVRRHVRESRRLERETEAAAALAYDEKAKSDAVIAALGDPLTIQDTDFRIIHQNQVLRDKVGDRVGEYCYRAYEGRDSICDGCPMVVTMGEGKIVTAIRKIMMNGATFFFENTASPVRDADGRIVAGIEVCRDITERAKAEEEIRELNGALEHRAADLAAKNRELEAFSYSLSHDLNTPLTKISVAVQALQDSYADRLDETGRFFVQSIVEGSERMEELIDAMLVLARIARRELRREEVDLSAMAAEVVDDLRQAEPQRRVEPVITPGLSATGDPALLRVMLQNLFANAWKYTRQTPEPRVEFGAVEHPGTTTYYVRDNGAGFEMKDLDRLFKPFQRLHDQEEFPGTGIGLATVQRIVERHGGSITAHGVPDHGATFTFTLGC